MRYQSKTEQWENGEFVRRGQKEQQTKLDREDQLNHLRNFLVQNGVEPFWANSALAWVRQAMAGNTHWATGLHHPKVTVDPKFHCVRTLSVKCTLHSVSDAVPGIIHYEHKDGHRVTVKAI
jgi:hypothetical protein